MIALKSVAQCDSNSVCTPKGVLKYLYIQNEKTAYLAKDTFNLGQILSSKNKQLILKDSLISNRNEALNICESEKQVNKIQIDFYKKENKSLNKKVGVFKGTTIGVAIVGAITNIMNLFR